MHQIFISFRSTEKNVAKRLKLELEKAGYSVWWQEALQCGQEWHGEIDKALASSRCVVVLWSTASIQSPWVQHEASQAIARGVYAPARIDPVSIPSPFNRIQAAPLLNWTKDEHFDDLAILLRRIKELLPSTASLALKALRRNVWNLIGVVLAAGSIHYLHSVNQSLTAQLEEIKTNSDRMDGTERRLQRVAENVESAEKAMKSVTADVRDSLEPELRFVYTKTVGASKSAYMRIENVGTGIARIKAVDARLDGVSIETDAATLSRHGACVGFAGYDVKVGESVAPGKPLTIFELPPQKIDDISSADRERERFFSRLSLVIQYESIFGKPKTLVLQYKGPRSQPTKATCSPKALTK